MLTALTGITIGIGLAAQTAINSQLRKYTGSPFLSSMVSFLIGTVFLAIVLLMSGQVLGVPRSLFSSQPLWIWLGGFCGVIALTTNILLFPKLGSVETSVMPFIGMTATGMLIDLFGWFNAIKQPFGMNRIFGIVLLAAGVFLAVVVQEIVSLHQKAGILKGAPANRWPWRLAGIGAGTLMAVQAAVNGRLGIVLQSPVRAAFVSFFVGSVLLILIVGLMERSYAAVKKPIQQSASWWVWMGGLIGAVYVLTNVSLVGMIGTGQTVVLTLVGQIAGSLLVQQFGLFHSAKNRIEPIQILGLLVMLAGVSLIKLL